MPLDPGIDAFLQFLAAAGMPPMYEGTPETARAGFRTLTVDSVTPDQVVAVGSTEDVEVAGLPARVYRPATDGALPTLVYLHGGGFVIGDLDTHDQTCRRLCAGADAVVVSIDYRLAPEHVWPAAVDDAIAAVTAVADRLDDFGGSPVLAVGGDSAGGNLAAIISQQMRDRIAGQLLIYPATHMLGEYASRVDNAEGYFLDMPTMEWFLAQYVPDGTDLDDPRLSPYTGDLAGLPPAVVVTAEFDPLRDEGEAYADALAAAGVAVDRMRYDGLIHGFIDMGPLSPAAAAAVDDMIGRTRALLHRDGA